MANIATNSNFLSTATNPGITYTGTIVNPYLSFSNIYEQIIYKDGTTSVPLTFSSISLLTEPSLITIDSGSCSDFSFTVGYAPLLTTVSSPNSLSFSIAASLSPLLTTITAPNAMFVTLGTSLTAVTTLSFPKFSRFTGTLGTTLASLTTLSLPELYTGGNFSITAPLLTTLSLPKYTYSQTFLPTLATLTSLSLPELTLLTGTGTILNPVCPLLTTFSTPKLTTIVDGSTAILNLAACTSLSMPLLANVGICTLTLPVLTTFSLPALVSASGLFTASLTLCTSFSLPVLANSAGFIATLPAATTLNLNALANVSVNLALTCATLTTFSLPAIVSVGTTFVITAANLVTFSLGSTLKSVGGNFTMSGMKLTQASVDGILVSLAALDGTNGTTAYSSKTVLLNGGTSATPSSTGLTAKATLVGRGCTVTTN